MNIPLYEATAAPEAALPAGVLSGETGRLPLVAMTVEADVVGLVSTMRVTQRFRNTFTRAIEATYVFPLPDRSAVLRFTVTIGDRRIEAVLMERGEARAAYDAAIAQGHRAATAEEERPDVFTTRVGNLQPGEEAEVELALVGPVACEAGEAVVRVPLVVAPRYIPGVPLEGPSVGEGTVPDTDAVPDASRITPPVLLPGSPNPVQLAVSVRIDPAGLQITGLRSSLHALADGSPGDGVVTGPVTVRLRPGERLDRDFVLRYRVGGAERGASAVFTPDEEGDEGTLCVTVLAPPVARRPRDVVVVLDRSGSMEGWKIVAARRAAARIVDTLETGDRFAVLAFDTVVERPPGLGLLGLEPATDRNRFRAVEFLARLEARGGTEMHGALAEALRLLAGGADDDRDDRDDRDPTCIVVTDGQVGNEDQLVRLVADAPRGVRMFTIGIDRAVNAGFLRRVAGAGAGRCDLVESEDRLDEVLRSLHRRISPPALRDVAVEASGVELIDSTATPSGPADCFPGVPLVTWRRYRGPGGGRVHVRSVDPAGRAVVEEAPAAVAANVAARATWARAMVRDLEDRYAAEDRPEVREALARRVVDASLRHGVLCRFTAFFAVDPSEVVPGAPHRVIQPVELPSGWAPAAVTGRSAAAPPRTMRMMAAGGGADLMGASIASLEVAPSPAAAGAVRPSPGVKRLRGESRPRPELSDAGALPVAYRPQVADLLARCDALGAAGDGEARRSVLADLAQLLDDLASVGARDHALAVALRRLEAALRADPVDAATLSAARAAVDEALAPAGKAGGPTGASAPAGGRRFWR